MEIQSDGLVTHPIDRVWETMRDRLPDLVPFLNGVESILVEEREETGPGRVRLLNIWQGNRIIVPKAARPFVSRNMLKFKDHAEWDDGSRQVTWRFETFRFDKLFDCAGTNTFEEASGGHTRILIRGRLDVYPERTPGVPRFLAGKLRPAIERFVVNLVGANLADLARGVQGFLDQG